MVKSLLSPSNRQAANIPESETKTVALDVGGMKCAGCVKAVEKQLEQNLGVVSACVNLITEVAVVKYQAANVTPEILAEKLTKTGFPSKLRQSDRSIYQIAKANQIKRQQQEQQWTQQLITATVLLVFSSIGHLHHLGLPTIPILSNIWIHFGLATLALLFPGRSLLVDGGRSLVQGMPNMNTLVASCFALFLPSLGWECFFDEPAMLLGFILLGGTLEGKARNRASAALEKLVMLQPPIARLIGKQENSGTIEIPVEQVKPGEWLRVLPGEKIPVDGKVIAGTTTVDEAMLTGESEAVVKTSLDLVRAGTINQSGVITLEVTGIGQDTTLAKIINLVETAQTRKAPVQQLADTIAGYFAYGVMAIATITFLFWYFVGTNLWDSVLTSDLHSLNMPMTEMADMMARNGTTSPLLLSLKLAIAVLVIACPCALGLATPTAILVGTSIGAESGILIKGGDVLERVQQLNTVVFDKTGTLTIGQPQVTECIPLTEITTQQLLQIAASIESGSNHPLAQAILTVAQKQNLTLLDTRDFVSVIGQGMSAMVAGQRTYLGNRQWLLNHGIEINQQQESQAQSLAQAGQTVIYLGNEANLQGLIALEDSMRADAIPTVQHLQSLNLNIVLLTGDRPEVAQAIAQKLKINQIFAEVKPEEKAQIIQSLQRDQTVAMVGDGINDAPALAQADVGIALQGGTDVAIATADIVLMQNQLQDVIKSIELSRATVNKIKQNLAWALAYNALAIPIAAGVLLPKYGVALSPVWAAVAMASSSLIVVTNSLLLKTDIA
jgi:P-type Cu2+ transporter